MNLNTEFLASISPFVRRVRIMQTLNLSGKWTDYDHNLTGIVSGEVDFQIRNIKYHLTAGDVILIPPHCPHTITPTKENSLIQYILHYDFFYDKSRSFFPENMSYKEYIQQYETPDIEKFLGSDPLIFHLNTQEFLEYQTIFLHLLNEFKDRKPFYDISMKMLCINILILCLRSPKTSSHPTARYSSKVRTNVQRTLEYIHLNYDDPELDIEQIAAAIQISPKYLSLIFREETGTQIHKYLNHVRIEAAKKLAVLGTMNVTEIADAVGYRSIHTFSKIFKKTTGLSPSSYIAKNHSHAEKIYIKNDAMNRPPIYK